MTDLNVKIDLDGYEWGLYIEPRNGRDCLVISPLLCDVQLPKEYETRWMQDPFLLWLMVAIADAAYDRGHDEGYSWGREQSLDR